MEGKVVLADGKVALADEKVALTGKEGIETNSETSFSSTDYRELLRAKLGKMTFNEVSKNRMIEMFYTYIHMDFQASLGAAKLWTISIGTLFSR
ncbi:hypothetical protein [Dialister succinatiphilus]|uniref:hypothetical protein n=1 Tax=Dialister succinatiphilus TaxID=487173 RepID=UPI003F7EB6D4